MKIIRISQSGKNFGDAAVWKLTLLYRDEGKTAHRDYALQQEEINFTPMHLDDLEKMPDGSLGQAYFQFMKRNKLSPLNFSAEVRPFFSTYPVSIRYIRLHDLFHTILGFEPDIAGEIGVYAFIGKQSYTETLNKAARMAHWVGRLLFWRRRKNLTAEQRGQELAKNAKSLIAEPLEEMLPLPLEEVREKLLGQSF